MNFREKTAALAGFTLGALSMGFLLFSLLALLQEAKAGELLGADASAWIEGEHTNRDQASITLGATLEWRYITLRLGHGIKKTEYRAIGEDTWQMDEWQSGTNTALLWHPTGPAFFRPHFIYRHASDITRGKPFNDEHEPTSDFFGVGFRLGEPGEYIELDFDYGLSARECALWDCAYNSNKSWEARVAVRILLWR